MRLPCQRDEDARPVVDPVGLLGLQPGRQPTTTAENRAVQRAVDVLDFLARADAAVGLSQVVRETGYSKATTLRILRTLLARGFVSRHGDGYTLGDRISSTSEHEIGLVDQLFRTLMPFMVELHRSVGAAVGLGVLGRGRVLYSPTLRDLSHPSRGDDRGRSAGCGAVERLLFAYHPGVLPPAGLSVSHRIGDVERARIRRAGFANSCAEHRIYQIDMAAPILLPGPGSIAALRVVSPGTTSGVDVVADRLRRAAHRMSAYVRSRPGSGVAG